MQCLTLDQYSDSDSDSSLLEHEIEEYILDYKDEKKNLHKSDQTDVSVLTLSKSFEIQNNNKIQFIKKMIDIITRDYFTYQENLTIHLVYNYNTNCLFLRTKLFMQYILILNFLKKYKIILPEYIRKLIFPKTPIKYGSKKYLKLNNEIKKHYKFNIVVDNSLNEKDCLINGIIFYLKNYILLNKSELNSEKNNIFIEKYLDPNNVFLEGKKTILISNWLNNLIKKIILFNHKTHIEQNKSIILKKINKNFEYQILSAFSIIAKFVLKLKRIENTKEQDKFIFFKRLDLFNEYVNIKTFIVLDYENTFIYKMISEEIFINFLNNFLQNKTIKTTINTNIIINNIISII